MPIESARAFFEKVKNDEKFRKQVAEIATPGERLEFIKVEGFDFTKEELDEVQAELGDEELDQVSGGKWCGRSHEGEQDCDIVTPWPCGVTHELES